MLEKSNIQLEFNDDGMAIINYEQFGKILKNLDNAVTKRGMGISAMIYGDAGIGKTQIIRQSCNRRIAELGDGRELILYNDYIEKFPNIKEFEDNLK